MSQNITAQTLFNRLQGRLRLVCLAGESGMNAEIDTASGDDSAAMVGHLNFIHPNRIQVLGRREMEYLEKLGKNSRCDALAQLFSDPTSVIVIAEKQDIPEQFMVLGNETGIPIWHSDVDSEELTSHFSYFLGNALAGSITLHGVYMEVMGSGVLLQGESGIGKSELALELISRGHRLVADDAPEFNRIAPDTINGICPPVLCDFLEVRGLGVLNIRSLFGDSAIKTNKYLRLIISLQKMSEAELLQMDRLRGSSRTRTILEVEIPEITLPVAPGRNLAVAVETAVRNHILKHKGYDAAEDFIQRQQRMLDQKPL